MTCLNVTSHDGRGPLRVAGLQGTDDLDVMRSAAQQLGGLISCKRPHHQRRFNQDGHQGSEPVVAGKTLNEAMKLTVEIADALNETIVAALAFGVLCLCERAQLLDAFSRDPRRRPG